MIKRTKLVSIIAGGTLSKPFLSDIKKSDYIIGVDRGAYWLLENGVIPDVAIGDFDSVSSSELALINRKIKKVNSFPTEKNATDLELALRFVIEQKPQEICMYGVSGTRLDHSQSALDLLVLSLKAGIPTQIIDDHNIIALGEGVVHVTKNNTYNYFSLLPFKDSMEVSISGCKYEVKHLHISKGETIGVSNEIVKDHAYITVHSGIALIIQSSD